MLALLSLSLEGGGGAGSSGGEGGWVSRETTSCLHSCDNERLIKHPMVRRNKTNNKKRNDVKSTAEVQLRSSECGSIYTGTDLKCLL